MITPYPAIFMYQGLTVFAVEGVCSVFADSHGFQWSQLCLSLDLLPYSPSVLIHGCLHHPLQRWKDLLYIDGYLKYYLIIKTRWVDLSDCLNWNKLLLYKDPWLYFYNWDNIIKSITMKKLVMNSLCLMYDISGDVEHGWILFSIGMISQWIIYCILAIPMMKKWSTK